MTPDMTRVVKYRPWHSNIEDAKFGLALIWPHP